MHDMQMPMQMPVVWGVRFTRCPGRLLTTHLPCTCLHMQASPGISWWTRCERGSRTRWAAGAGAASQGQVVWELHGMHATVCLHLHPVMCLHLPPLPLPHCNCGGSPVTPFRALDGIVQASVAYYLMADNRRRMPSSAYLKEEMTEATDPGLAAFPSGAPSWCRASCLHCLVWLGCVAGHAKAALSAR